MHADEHRTTPFCACDCPDCEGPRHVIHTEPGFPRVVRGVVDPPEPYVFPRRALRDVPIRSERDRLTPELVAEGTDGPADAGATESENRMLWGDR